MHLNDKQSARGNSLTLQLYSFPSANISDVIDFLSAKGINNVTIPATGGGGHKYAALFAVPILKSLFWWRWTVWSWELWVFTF